MTIAAIIIGSLAIFLPGMIVGAVAAFLYKGALSLLLGLGDDPSVLYWFSPLLHGGLAGATAALLTARLVPRANFDSVKYVVPAIHIGIATALTTQVTQLRGLEGLGGPGDFLSFVVMALAGAGFFYITIQEVAPA